MERKKIRISPERQITIPKKFYDLLGFADKAECFVCDGELVIRPVKVSHDDERITKSFPESNG